MRDKVTVELVDLAREYVNARQAQERGDHTDELLAWDRTDAHDEFMVACDVAGVHYDDREHAARLAVEMCGSDALNGNDTPTWLVDVCRKWYSPELLKSWIRRASGDGWPEWRYTKKRESSGQLERWRDVLAVLEGTNGV